MSLEFWRTFAFYGMALGQTLFVALYLTFPWYKTFLGRALFYKAFVLALVLDLFLIARRYPTLLSWDAVFVSLYALLGFGVWFQFFAFLRVRTEGKRAERDTRMSTLGHDDQHQHRYETPEETLDRLSGDQQGRGERP